MNRPSFMIIGEARCGSTTLWNMLSQYKDIYFPTEKELHYFSSYSRFQPCGRSTEGRLSQYLEQFDDATPTQVCGESTPNYLSDPHALNRIKIALGNLKCIIILRDPVARAYSHYWQSVGRGWEDLTFEKAIKSENSRLSDPLNFDAFHDFSYFTRGLYAKNLERTFQLFGRDNCLIFFLEEMKIDQKKAHAALEDFLSLNSSPKSKNKITHSNRYQYSTTPKLSWCQRRFEKLVFRKHPETKLHKLYKTIGSVTRKYRTTNSQPKIPKKTLEILRQKYNSPNKMLEEMVGRPLPW